MTSVATAAQNLLKNRDKETIDAIETSFASGRLRQAIEQAPQIERCTRLTAADFERDYRRRFEPVVVEGLIEDWPARRTWSFDVLNDKCAAATVVVDSYNSKRARKATFGEFVAMMRARQRDEEPIYLQEWLYMADCPFLADDLPELPIAQYDFRRALYGEKISTNHQLWIGQKGATTRLHQDSYVVDVLHAQLVGDKHWAVLSPDAHLGLDASGELDFDALAADPGTRILTCVLHPGDVLYLPALWWHRVKLLDDSIGLGRKCLDEANLRTHVRLRLAELLALALNHEHVRETHPELYQVVVLRNRAWAKLLDIDLTNLRP
ncbi:MAG TPA: cupin-like domain-containing protein [Thermoanaerobaculia bacterium]|jgi:hypothetical protein|nr:cupin-like domain-containing protein [Thermoanaerobaculia bacterium]